MKKRFIGLTLLLATWGWAQETEAPEPAWTHQLVGSVSANQVAFKDWSQGGDDALSWTLSLEGKSIFKSGLFSAENQYKFAFGQTKLGSQSIRKSVDKISLETLLGYKIDRFVNPYASVTLKSQFARGYKYNDAGRTAVSHFFDPAYLTQGAGVGYKPSEHFRTRLGLALREIITRDFNSFSDDQETAKIEQVDVDGGLEWVTDLQWNMAENIQFTAKFEVFTPISGLGDTTMRNDNLLALKVNEFVHVNINVQIVEDQTAAAQTQLKESLAVGLNYSFI